MPQECRKNFSIEVINKVYEKQGHCCAKCGLPLTYGFNAHHIDGKNSNDFEDNCALLHPRCHGAEQWTTIKTQKEKALEQIGGLINAALEGKLAGALVKEVNELLEKELSLQNQLYGIEHFTEPAKTRIEYSEAVARANLEAYQSGYMDCLKNIPALIQSGVVKNTKQ